MEEENAQNTQPVENQENNFIDSLKKYNEENMKKDIFVPSLGRSIKFSLLSTKQQRYIIESSLDNPIYNVTFHLKTHQIIKELAEETSLIDALNVFDKDAILIQLRYYYIDTTYNDKDFSNVIENIKNPPQPNSMKTENVDGFTVSMKIPSIKEELDIYKNFKSSKFYKISPEGDDDVRSMVATLYILELSKYVSTITIDETGASVNFNNIELDKKIEILDHLGKKVAKSIQAFINDTRTAYDAYYKIDDDTFIEVTPELFS